MFSANDGEMIDKYIKHTEPIAEVMRRMYPICLERKALYDRVKKLMDWDDEKTNMWFMSKNPEFGMITPDHLLVSGRGVAVESFIKEAEADKAHKNAY